MSKDNYLNRQAAEQARENLTVEDIADMAVRIEDGEFYGEEIVASSGISEVGEEDSDYSSDIDRV